MRKDSVLDLMGRYPDEVVKLDKASRAVVWLYRDRPSEGQTGVFGFVGNQMRERKILEDHHKVCSERDYICFLDCYSYLRESATCMTSQDKSGRKSCHL
jgi:hypothetical protein